MGEEKKIDSKSNRVELMQHTDIKVVATLLCNRMAFLQDNNSFTVFDSPKITLKGVTRKKGTGQCRFLLENRGDVKFSALIMAYYNDRLFVSSKAFITKMSDLKDLINDGKNEDRRRH